MSAPMIETTHREAKVQSYYTWRASNYDTGTGFEAEHHVEAIYHLNPHWLGGCRGVWLSSALEEVGFTNIYRETISQLGFPSEIITATAQ